MFEIVSCKIRTQLIHAGVCVQYVFVSQPVVLPKEALMTQGVEGGWVVTVEIWLATGHHWSSKAQPRCTHGGNSLGSAWVLGLGRLWSTPLIRLQIASYGFMSGPGPCEGRSELFFRNDQSRREGVREKETEKGRKKEKAN